jgi:hypothetical protein
MEDPPDWSTRVAKALLFLLSLPSLAFDLGQVHTMSFVSLASSILCCDTALYDHHSRRVPCDRPRFLEANLIELGNLSTCSFATSDAALGCHNRKATNADGEEAVHCIRHVATSRSHFYPRHQSQASTANLVPPSKVHKTVLSLLYQNARPPFYSSPGASVLGSTPSAVEGLEVTNFQPPSTLMSIPLTNSFSIKLKGE